MATEVFEYTTPPAIHDEAEAGRSRKVREQIEYLHQTLSTCTLDMADLLAEAKDKNYTKEWGFTNFAQFTKELLDMSERQAYYLIRIVQTATKLEIPRKKLEDAAISKLKEIFTLDPAGVFHNPQTSLDESLTDHIKRLVDLAPVTSLDIVKAEVKRLKGLNTEDELTWVNFQVTRRVKEEIIMPALERCKREYGDSINAQGEIADISDGRALEYICADFNAAPNEVLHEIFAMMKKAAPDAEQPTTEEA